MRTLYTDRLPGMEPAAEGKFGERSIHVKEIIHLLNAIMDYKLLSTSNYHACVAPILFLKHLLIFFVTSVDLIRERMPVRWYCHRALANSNTPPVQVLYLIHAAHAVPNETSLIPLIVWKLYGRYEDLIKQYEIPFYEC